MATSRPELSARGLRARTEVADPSFPGGRPPQTIGNRRTETFFRNGLYEDRVESRAIETMERREEIGRRLPEVARSGEDFDRDEAGRRRPFFLQAKQPTSLVPRGKRRPPFQEDDPRAWSVVAFELSRGARRLGRFRDFELSDQGLDTVDFRPADPQ